MFTDGVWSYRVDNSLQLHKWGHTNQGLWRHAKPALDKNRRHEQVICPIYPILSLLQ